MSTLNVEQNEKQGQYDKYGRIPDLSATGESISCCFYSLSLFLPTRTPKNPKSPNLH